MKEYQNPRLEHISLRVEDVITESSTVNSIVSSADQSASDEIQMSDWNNAWN